MSVDIKLDKDCIHVVFLGLPNVPGVASKIFSTLAQNNFNFDMITQNTMRGGRSDVSFLINKNKLDDVIPICRKLSDDIGAQGVSFATEIAAIKVNNNNSQEALVKMFNALANAGANIEIINATTESVIFIISLTHADSAFNALNKIFED
ncbi:MAG: ACT domain-containing protein [Synergistaceae bacterium]|nr:ACT domain-containing protein [Synergistaceae bacterium]MBQ4418613.1 ACT domain-containing protein [Synergistaceae bacterium]MBQ6740221.1 ACT domain-containing protein [Synergistaceae bacterium]MBQ9581542.1 ACT domain-containing protein [Synergistaceae bacterium]MBQ9896997.1 ACT domain-containing protein [Synergistaceae bacterium]